MIRADSTQDLRGLLCSRGSNIHLVEQQYSFRCRPRGRGRAHFSVTPFRALPRSSRYSGRLRTRFAPDALSALEIRLCKKTCRPKKAAKRPGSSMVLATLSVSLPACRLQRPPSSIQPAT